MLRGSKSGRKRREGNHDEVHRWHCCCGSAVRHRRRTDRSQGVASISRRQGRRARRHGADDRSRGGGGQRRSHHPGLSGRLAVQAQRPVERHGQWPARHCAVSARLRERQSADLQRHADARPHPQPGPREAHQRFAVHDGHPRRDRENGVIVLSDAWFAGGMAGKGQLHPEAVRSQGHEIPRRRADLCGDVGSSRRQHRQPAVERNLQRVPDRRRQRAPTPASAPSLRRGSTRSPSASRRRATTRSGSCTSPC